MKDFKLYGLEISIFREARDEDGIKKSKDYLSFAFLDASPVSKFI